jgi:type VI secretion system protein ImpL
MQNILIFLQAYLFGRLGSRILGLMLILSLIWWAGPYIGLTDPQLRIHLIIGTLALFFGIWLLRKWIVGKRAARFKKDLDSQAGQDQSRQMEIEELRTKMNEAIASLKSSELGSRHHGNAALYALPWFMIIGPAAAGKTTLLRNSGLNFPYASGDDIDIRGFGGTRNCDWWFSNEAVLLDTAGRYTTEKDDHEEWMAFLGMLRKHRRQQPLTGAIVAVSMSDLLTADAQELERHVKIIRDKIEELTSRLGCIFPIYIVFTKCDLLYGFSSYFADLTPEEREQVWGTWLGHTHDSNISEAFARKMDTLHYRLCELRLQKLSMVRNKKVKTELFDFPRQFDAAKDRLVRFIQSLTEENPYQDTPHFCGIYMTSATQEGTPLQKILGSMRQAFGYVDEDQSSESPEPKTFFVKNFFKQVVFPNANDVSRTRRMSIIHHVTKTAAILVSLGAIAGCFLLMSTTLTMNSLLLKKGVDASKGLVRAAQSEESNAYQDFQALTKVLEHYRTLLSYEEELPLSLKVGIYEGGKQLPATRSLLLNHFEQAFYTPSLKAMETRLADYCMNWSSSKEKGREKIREPYYQALKCYRMLGEPERIDTDYVAPFLEEIIRERLSDNPEEQPLEESDLQILSELVQIYLSHMLLEKNDPYYFAPHKPNETVVADAQEQLKSKPNAGRLYSQILTKGKLKMPVLQLNDLVKGAGGDLLSSSVKIPTMYTSDGWRNYVQPEIKTLVKTAVQGDWVTGYMQETPSETGDSESDALSSDALAANLETDIRVLYFKDYVDYWYNLLDDVEMVSFKSLDDAAKKMLILAGEGSPISELFQVVSKNINIAQTDGVTLAKDGSINAVSLVTELDAPFRNLRKLTDPGSTTNVNPLVEQYLLALASAQAEMEQIAAAVDIPRQSYQYAVSILGDNGGAGSQLYQSWLSTNSLLNGIDSRNRKMAKRLLGAPIKQTWYNILRQTRSYLQNQWNGSVLASYSGKISGKFPFDETGETDASLNDISDFFRPDDGQIWTFLDSQLTPFLKKKSSEWTEKKWLGYGLNFNQDLFTSLSQASEISSGLFRSGQIQPDIQFSIYPIPCSGVRVVRFKTNGQDLVYQNEPQEWKGFKWPGDQEQSSAVIGCVPSGNQALTKLEYSGDWSLLRLLHQADVSVDSDLYHLVWELETEEGSPVLVQLTLRPDRQSNIFANGLFSQFQLPSSIF